MFNPLALVLIPLGYLYLWPLADRILRDKANPAPAVQVVLTALALSVGSLTLILFWLGLLPGRWITGAAALGIVVLGLMVGLALNPGWASPARWRAYWLHHWTRLARLDLESLLTGVLIGAGFVILVFDLYYPFIGDDVLVRYGPQAQTIYRAGAIPSTLAGYPPLAPLAFAATWLATGNPNEHLARLFPAVMATATLGAAYLLGRRADGRRAGLLAASLAAITPLFVNNATLAYTDIPTAFPLALATLYAVQWWETGRVRDALLAGVMLGLGAFTKQSALTWPASLALVPVMWLAANRRGMTPAGWRRALTGLAGMLVPAMAIAGPWYLRNLILRNPGGIVPEAGLYHLLEPGVGLPGLLPSLAWVREFGIVPAILYAAGWVMGIIGAIRQAAAVIGARQPGPPEDLIFAAAAVPYWLIWWVRFSFDPRFLLLILPIMAVWAARPLSWLIDRAGERLRLPRIAWQVAGGLALLGLLVWGTYDRLGGVYRAIAYPFASDGERLAHAKGSLFHLVQYVRDNLDPGSDRLYLLDERMAYYLADFDTATGYPRRLSDLEGFDFVIHNSALYAVYGDGRLGLQDSEFYVHAFDPQVFEPVFVVDGVHIMRILRYSLPAGAAGEE